MSAIIYFTNGKGVALRETPSGAVITYLADGAPVKILEGREWVHGLQWIQVRDAKERTGWVLAQFVAIRP
jgi:SH3-like domain-containing protein